MNPTDLMICKAICKKLVVGNNVIAHRNVTPTAGQVTTVLKAMLYVGGRVKVKLDFAGSNRFDGNIYVNGELVHSFVRDSNISTYEYQLNVLPFSEILVNGELTGTTAMIATYLYGDLVDNTQQYYREIYGG